MATANRMPSFLATMRREGGDKLSLDKRDPGDRRANYRENFITLERSKT